MIDSPLSSVASMQTLDGAFTAEAKPRVTEHVLLTFAATSLPPGFPVPDLGADYHYDAQENYLNFIPLKMTHEEVRDHGLPGDPSSASGGSTLSFSSSRNKKKIKEKRVKKEEE